MNDPKRFFSVNYPSDLTSLTKIPLLRADQAYFSKNGQPPVKFKTIFEKLSEKLAM